ELDELDAAIVRVADAADQPLPGEAVDEDGHVPRRQAQGLADLAHADRSLLEAEPEEEGGPRDGQPAVGRHAREHPLPQAAAQIRERAEELLAGHRRGPLAARARLGLR